MREAAALTAALYVMGYLLIRAWRRRRPGRVVVLCPLGEGGVPPEIVERLTPPTPVAELEPFLPAEFTVAYLTDAPGISLATMKDESSLEATIGSLVRHTIFVPRRDHWQTVLDQGN